MAHIVAEKNHPITIQITDTPKALKGIVDELNSGKIVDLDSYLKYQIDWYHIDTDHFFPAEKFHNFITSIHDKMIRLMIIRFLIKYTDLYFKRQIREKKVTKSFTDWDYEELNPDPIGDFKQMLQALQDQMESEGEFSFEKLKELTEENEQLRQQISELQTLHNGEKGSEVNTPPSEKQKNKPGRKTKKTRDQYGDPSCIFNKDDRTGETTWAKDAFVKLCNTLPTPTAVYREMKTTDRRYLFLLGIDDADELAYYLEENAKETNLYTVAHKKFTPTIIRNVNSQINREKGER